MLAGGSSGSGDDLEEMRGERGGVGGRRTARPHLPGRGLRTPGRWERHGVQPAVRGQWLRPGLPQQQQQRWGPPREAAAVGSEKHFLQLGGAQGATCMTGRGVGRLSLEARAAGPTPTPLRAGLPSPRVHRVKASPALPHAPAGWFTTSAE